MAIPCSRAGVSVAVSGFLILATTTSPLRASMESAAIDVPVPFTSDAGSQSRDVSGLSCLAPVNGEHICLVIDDKGRQAQAATIAMLADGRMILLAGPAQLQAIGYAVFRFDPKTGVVSRLAELDDLAPNAKAEALQVLSDDGARLDVIIMFDGLKGGGARRYVIEQ
jgi:hypothetical protein